MRSLISIALTLVLSGAALAGPSIASARTAKVLVDANRPAGDAADQTNAALFAALKPGGTLLVVDHSAVAGAPLTVADTLHRIDPAVARAEIEKAGFVFDGELPIYRNAADPRTTLVFDPLIRGKTDQFVNRFRKPR